MRRQVRFYILLGCAFFLSLLSLSAQRNPKGLVSLSPVDSLGLSDLTVTYRYRIYDPVMKKDKVVDYISLIGSRYTVWRDLGSFREDTFLCARRYIVTREQRNRLYDAFNIDDRIYTLRMDKGNNLLREVAFAMGTKVYEEEIPTFSWELQEGEDTIAGYLCAKASADFRGRKWTAWYTEELPISEGPWKFRGLPGLILKVESADNEHVMSCIAVRKEAVPMHVTVRNSPRMKRLIWHQLIARYCWNFSDVISSTVSTADPADAVFPTDNVRMFYNPIELDWMKKDKE